MLAITLHGPEHNFVCRLCDPRSSGHWPAVAERTVRRTSRRRSGRAGSTRLLWSAGPSYGAGALPRPRSRPWQLHGASPQSQRVLRGRPDGLPECFRRARPAQVDISRLILQLSPKAVGKRRGALPVEIRGRTVPFDLTVGERNQQAMAALDLGAPVVDFLGNPLRPLRFRRGEQDEETRPIERRDDRRPEARLGGEAYVITKDAERACSVPGLRKALQSSLQRRRESAIGGAVVGDKSVIDVVARRRRCKP
jgi:hypothetical protein